MPIREMLSLLYIVNRKKPAKIMEIDEKLPAARKYANYWQPGEDLRRNGGGNSIVFVVYGQGRNKRINKGGISQ